MLTRSWWCYSRDLQSQVTSRLSISNSHAQHCWPALVWCRQNINKSLRNIFYVNTNQEEAEENKLGPSRGRVSSCNVIILEIGRNLQLESHGVSVRNEWGLLTGTCQHFQHLDNCYRIRRRGKTFASLTIHYHFKIEPWTQIRGEFFSSLLYSILISGRRLTAGQIFSFLSKQIIG